MASKYFIQDDENKVVILDGTVIPTAAEDRYVNALIAGGYKPRMKSEKKAKQMKARADKQPSDEDILEALKNDPANLQKYKDIKRDKDEKGKPITENYNGKKGFFAARSWYVKEIADKAKKASK